MSAWGIRAPPVQMATALLPPAPVTWAEMAVTAAAFGLVLATAYAATSTRTEGYQNRATGVDYEVFFAVVQAYKGILDRPPSEAEVQAQRTRLETDDGYDVPALERALRSSPEYRRLVALQKNLVFAEMEGLVTEEQIRGKVASMYLATTGGAPDAPTLDFLLERYRKSQLNDAQLQALIESIYGVGQGGSAAGVGAEAAPASAASASATAAEAAATAAASGTAEEQLYGKLGLTAGEIARIVASTSEGGSRPPACPRRVSADDEAHPDDVMAAVRKRGLDEVRAMCRSNARSDRADELARAGYGAGDPIGSWTMPKPLAAPVCIAARKSEVRPDRSQTSLIGTLLEDAAGTQNLNLF